MLIKISSFILAVLVWEGCKHAIESNILIAEADTGEVIIETFQRSSRDTVKNWVSTNCKNVPNFGYNHIENEVLVSCLREKAFVPQEETWSN